MSKYRVIETMEGRHPLHADYPLLRGDIIAKHSEDGWIKHAPGLSIWGFQLSDEDIAKRCEPADDARWVIA
jgi:hypothetical protein